MPTVRRFTGVRVSMLAWTAVLGALVAVGATEYRPLVSSYVPVAEFVAYAAGGWLGGLAFFWIRERRHWRRMAAATRFDYQGPPGGTYPPLHARIGGGTVTAEAVAPSRLGRIHTHLRSSIDGVDDPVRIRLRHVGSGGGDEGLTLGNPTLDEQFVVATRTPDWVGPVLSPEVQSTLMDLDVPGTIRVSERAVVFDVPFTRLSGSELHRCAKVVATLSNQLEGAHPGFSQLG